MVVGVPKEIKIGEHRVGLLPHHVKFIVDTLKVPVVVQRGAGSGINICDEAYHEAGATIVDTLEQVYDRSTIIIKVKEPLPIEFALLHSDHIIFTYLHAAGNIALCQAFIDSKATGIAYETIVDDHGRLPLLRPMSEVAGRLSMQVASQYIHLQYGGSGKLLGGVTGTEQGNVLVLGAGVVGSNAVSVAVGLGCNVTVLDKSLDALTAVRNIHGSRVQAMVYNHNTRDRLLPTSDVVIGAILNRGEQAEKLLTEDSIKSLPRGSVLVDVAIDQGGCSETSRATTHQDPVYVEHGVVHYCVANMPSAVARTATEALTNATFPYVIRLIDEGATTLNGGINFQDGNIVCEGVKIAMP